MPYTREEPLVSTRYRCAFLFLVLMVAVVRAAHAQGIVDTHAHIINQGRSTDFAGSLEAAIERMDESGIRVAIVMPPPMPPGHRGIYDLEAYAGAAAAYPQRFLLAGGGGTLNAMLHGVAADAVTDEVRKRFRERAEEIVRAGAVAFGEITLHHLSNTTMGPQHPYEWVSPEHPLMLLLADIAAEKDIPIDLHVDLVPADMSLPERPAFGPANPPILKANLAGFELLLGHNRKARIVWAHAGTDPLGTRRPGIQRELLSRHPNLYMSLRLSRTGPQPVFAVGPNQRLKKGWIALLRDFPDRFVVGSDFFHGVAGASPRRRGEGSLGVYRDVLADLPPDLAAAIMYGNAQRIYRIGEMRQR